jgi:hypothetical protein
VGKRGKVGLENDRGFHARLGRGSRRRSDTIQTESPDGQIMCTDQSYRGPAYEVSLSRCACGESAFVHCTLGGIGKLPAVGNHAWQLLGHNLSPTFI